MHFYEHSFAEFNEWMADIDALHGAIWLVLAGMMLAFALGVFVAGCAETGTTLIGSLPI
jgi:hypothetical protein